MEPITIILPGERPMSWNKLYSGKHWNVRHTEAARVHLLVRAYLDPDWPMFDCPVEIEVRVYFAKNPFDWSNIPAKMYEDGLIGWLIKDDSPKFVQAGRVVSLLDRRNPRVEIEIKPIEKGENG
jgi:hypothetical protein